ncbi:mycothiol synthase [Oerskovia sp. M15]
MVPCTLPSRSAPGPRHRGRGPRAGRGGPGDRRRRPLSEQPLLRLGVDDEDLTHVVTYDGAGAVTGYAQIDRGVTSPAPSSSCTRPHADVGPAACSCARPSATRPCPHVRANPASTAAPCTWAHGDLPAARAFAADAGSSSCATCGRWAWTCGPGRGAPAGPRGPAVADVPPGPDDAAWLRVNARAFAHHPEQGRLTQADLDARTAEDWFDSEGFFLLERDDSSLAGFLWTKVTDGQAGRPGADVREGEIYALGVDPDAQGAGLGKVLTAVGLAHLAARGLDRAVLYVDGDNAAATRTYLGAGSRRTPSTCSTGHRLCIPSPKVHRVMPP